MPLTVAVFVLVMAVPSSSRMLRSSALESFGSASSYKQKAHLESTLTNTVKMKREPVEGLEIQVSFLQTAVRHFVSPEVSTLPSSIMQSFANVAMQERKALLQGSQPGAKPANITSGSVFEAVSISLPIASPVLDHDPASGLGQGDKNIAASHELAMQGKNCVVYGLGVANNSDFETHMASLGCQTHAFDCSVSPSSPAVMGKLFTFHNWCIGKKGNTSFDGNVYAGQQNAQALQFKTLNETMTLLGHDHISLLKFDIEGFEWSLFESEILKAQRPPDQLAFELHTERARPEFVPPDLSNGKDYVAVNSLFLALHDKGYRVVSKELNSYDNACAEFVSVNVNA